MKTVNTLDSGLDSVEICKLNGWVPGTRLVGDEGYGPDEIEITAIGRETVLAVRTVGNHNDYEGSWSLTEREWSEVKHET